MKLLIEIFIFVTFSLTQQQQQQKQCVSWKGEGGIMLLLFPNRLRHVDDDKVTLATWLVSVCLYLGTIHPFSSLGTSHHQQPRSPGYECLWVCVCVCVWRWGMSHFYDDIFITIVTTRTPPSLALLRSDRAKTQEDEKLHFFVLLLSCSDDCTRFYPVLSSFALF